jgi:hypothetical protein
MRTLFCQSSPPGYEQSTPSLSCMAVLKFELSYQGATGSGQVKCRIIYNSRFLRTVTSMIKATFIKQIYTESPLSIYLYSGRE